jgi:RNA exonuclease 1
MCKTDIDKFELTRISVLGWDGNVILDELVKPLVPITDYLTPYSGITEDMLKPVTTRLGDIQKRLQEIITPSTIIIGHSLDGDFKALHMTHPVIIDTAIIYPHPRGPPLKSSLKWLSQKYLGREIQKSHGTTGHDSVEDARAVLDLVKQKCEKGPLWGTSEASNESIFNRLKRSQVPKLFRVDPEVDEYRTGAAIDWGNPRRGLGANADVILGCQNDVEVAEGVKSLLTPDGTSDRGKAVDFIWARFREVEAVRGWWEKSKTNDNNELRQNVLAKHSLTEDNVKSLKPNAAALSKAVAQTVQHISDIYDALPPCTAFIVYSGHGDPREVFRLQALHQKFRHEYKTKKWDQLSVKWTDAEEQAMRKACKKAREGVAFITVK